MVEPVIEEATRENAGRLKVVKVNVDEAPAVSARYGVQGIPALVIVRDGQEVDRIVGAVPKQQLEQTLAGDVEEPTAAGSRADAMSDATGSSARDAGPRRAYPRLSDDQLAALKQRGEHRRTDPGEVLFREGEANDEFLVVVEGLVKVVTSSGGEERLVAVHGPGRFLGELNLLTGQASFITAIAAQEGEVLAVPIDALRKVVAEDSLLGTSSCARP